MKHIAILIFFICMMSNSAKAQDLIVTIHLDSVFCKIDRTDDRFVYYRTAKTKRTGYELISKREVKDMVYGFGTASGQTVEPVREKRGYEMLQLWGGGGFSRVFSGGAEPPEDFEEYYSKLRSGFFYTGGLNVFLNESIGLGGFFSASNYSNSVDVINTTTMVTGKLSDDISLTYIGVNLAIRVIPDNVNMTFQFNFGLGQSRYVNEAAVIYPYRVEGNAVGGHASAELQLKLGQGIYLPIYVRLMGFNINEIQFTPGADVLPADEEVLRNIVLSSVPINISRFQIGAGLCFSF